MPNAVARIALACGRRKKLPDDRNVNAREATALERYRARILLEGRIKIGARERWSRTSRIKAAIQTCKVNWGSQPCFSACLALQ